jgi:hypothetical protein
VTQVHVVPSGDEPETHTLGNCHCQPRKRPRRREDGSIIDWVHAHRSLTDNDTTG